MKKKILPLLLMISSLLYGGDGNMLDYYKDGVYNTTSLINKHLREGLQETVLDQYHDKYLVLTKLDNLSFVDIIFYENIAEKEQILDVKIVKKTPSGESFMVFGSFDRKADADMIQNRLMESEVESTVVKNTDSRNAYVTNPLIVKKFLGDIRELIKDMPVKVVKIETTVAKDGSDCKVIAPPPLQYESARAPFLWLAEEFSKIESAWISGGEVPASGLNYVAFRRTTGALSGRKNYFIIGEKIGCFTLENIIRNDYALSDSINLRGPDGKLYVATRKSRPASATKPKKAAYVPVKHKIKVAATTKPCGKGLDSDFCPDVEVSPKAEAPIGEKSSSSARCDFNGINLVKQSGRSVRTTSTPYSGKEIDVAVVANKPGYVTVKASGMPAIDVSLNSFNEKCIK